MNLAQRAGEDASGDWFHTTVEGGLPSSSGLQNLDGLEIERDTWEREAHRRVVACLVATQLKHGISFWSAFFDGKYHHELETATLELGERAGSVVRTHQRHVWTVEHKAERETTRVDKCFAQVS